MRLLVAREAEAAEISAAALRAMGHAAQAAPVSQVVHTPGPLNLGDVQALAFTSRNAVAAFLVTSERRDLRAFAVGPATAEALRAATFKRVEEGPSDGQALAGFMAGRLDPADGAVLHVSGERLAFDLTADLQRRGFLARQATLYRAVPAAALPAEVLEGMRAGRFEAVLLYSAAGVERFAALCGASGLAPQVQNLAALCISPAVAQIAHSQGFKAIRTAEAPREPSLFALLGCA